MKLTATRVFLSKSLCGATAALVLCAAAPRLNANSETEALLDLLVKKGIVTDREAEALAAKAAQDTKDNKNPAPDYGIDNKFLGIDSYVQSIKLYGDARFRYDAREGQSALSNDYADRDRARYRFRLNLDVTLNDQWFLGFRLETSNDGRSTNVTLGSVPFAGKGSFSPASFGSTVFVGQLYLKYTPTDYLTLMIGRMPNPLVSTPMVWDPDINPEGAAEQFKWTFSPNGVVRTGFGKDGKNVSEPAPASGFSVDLFANFLQFLVDQGGPQNSFGDIGQHADSWLLVEQVGAKVNFNKSTYFQLAPTYMSYTARGNDLTTDFSGEYLGNQNGIDDLQIFDLPAEFGFQAFGLPITVFGDFALNLEASGRAERAGHAERGDDDNIAWMAGVGIGKIQKQGDLAAKVYFQHTEQYAVDPNLVDNELFDSRLNMQGVVVRADYAVTDFLSVGVLYNYGVRIDQAVGTGGSDGVLSASLPLQDYNMFQFDVNVKF